jgi:hypothetical protein
MKVFLSYRREDSQGVVDRVAERLRRKLGPGNVFKDVDSISVGENFLDKVQTALTAADVLIVVIGPGWLNASKRPGKRRLDDPDDWVRIEVHEALQRDDVRVVPLLVEGATMPGERDLPAGLKALAYRNACILRPDPVFEADLDTLCERLDPEPEAESETSALRAVDIPQVTAAGGGTQQAHTTGSPGLRQLVVFVLAAAGVAILAIALLIASRVTPRGKPNTEVADPQAKIPPNKQKLSLQDESQGPRKEDILLADSMEALLSYKTVSTFITFGYENVKKQARAIRDGISRLRSGELHSYAQHTEVADLQAKIPPNKQKLSLQDESQGPRKEDILLADSMEALLSYKTVSTFITFGDENVKKQARAIRDGISRLRSGELHSHAQR